MSSSNNNTVICPVCFQVLNEVDIHKHMSENGCLELPRAPDPPLVEAKVVAEAEAIQSLEEIPLQQPKWAQVPAIPLDPDGVVFATDQFDDMLYQVCSGGDLNLLKEILMFSKVHRRNINMRNPKDRDMSLDGAIVGRTPLIVAIVNGHVDVVLHLIKDGANLDHTDFYFGRPPLLWAISESRWDMFQILLEMGADPNGKDKLAGETALYRVACMGQLQAVQELLGKAADPNLSNLRSRTPFYAACTTSLYPQAEIVHAMIHHGAIVTKEILLDTTNETIRHILRCQAYLQQGDAGDMLMDGNDDPRDIIHEMARHSRYATAFGKIFQQDPSIIHCKDKEGRSVLQVACRACRKVTLFLGRYDIDTIPKYESKTCQVYFAQDYYSNGGSDAAEKEEKEEEVQGKGKGTVVENEDEGKVDASSSPGAPASTSNTTTKTTTTTAVAMKFMKEKLHYESERNSRRTENGRARFETKYITQDVAWHDSDNDKEFAEECKLWKKPPYCLVMEQGDRSLEEAFRAENLTSKPLEVRSIGLQVAECLANLHELGYIHGDIKPKNILRQMNDKCWKLIDFDACVQKGHNPSPKQSTAFVPPEMLLVVDETAGVNGNDTTMAGGGSSSSIGESETPQQQPKKADFSFDVWSFGIMMYQLVTGMSFFHADVQDNLIDIEDLRNLSNDFVSKRLENVSDRSARVLLKRILRRNPSDRLTMKEVLQEAFFRVQTPEGEATTPLQHDFPKDFVFVNYRRGDSAEFAERLAQSLVDELGGDPSAVFFDKGSIDAGQQWPQRIQSALQSCRYRLAVIGRTWLTSGINKWGQRRIDLPGDWVRQEISYALHQQDDDGGTTSSTVVIPVLVGDAEFPPPDVLPDDIASLTTWQLVRVREEHWDTDIAALVSQISNVDGEH